MNITYTSERKFTPEQLMDLFSSVGWLSAQYPARLYKALCSCETVISAWDNEVLVGLVNAIDDGELTAYVHYLLVRPQYQGSGIGKKLVEQIKQNYEDYLSIVLIAEHQKVVGFYQKEGFMVQEGASPMLIQNL